MADIKKTAEVEIREKGLDELNSGLEQTEKNLNDIQEPAKKTSQNLEEVGKNGGAIATLDRLTGGFASQIRDAAEASKLFALSLKSIRTALIATGIGALVVALGTIVVYWEDIVDFVEGTNKKLDEQLKLVQKEAELAEQRMSVLDAEEQLLIAQGESTEKIRAAKREQLQYSVGILGAELATLQAQRDQAALEIARNNERLGILNALTFGAFGTADEGPLAELDKQISETTTKVLQLQTLLATGEFEDEQRAFESRERGETVDPLTGLGIAEIQTNTEIITGNLLDSLKIRNDVLRSEQAKADRDAKIQAQRAADEQLAIEEEKQFRRQGLVMQGIDLLFQLGESNKGFAIAAIVADQIASVAQIIQATGIANAKAVAASPLTFGQPWVGFNTASAALSIGTGLVAAQQAISRLRSDATSAGNFGAAQIQPSAAPAATQPTNIAIQEPDFNIVGDSGINQLADEIRRREERPVQAFVSTEQLNNAGELDRRIQADASIG